MIQTALENMIDGADPVSLLYGTCIIVVPAIVFMIHGIVAGRGVMFAVHMLLLAFYAYCFWDIRNEYADAFLMASGSVKDMLTLFVCILIPVVVCVFIANRFFPQKK